jgi:hypothetical protein
METDTMEDFNALAAALGAGIADVRACLILSGDGLVLGANPVTAEADARSARIKLAALGEPERGFLQFGTEVWCYVRRGPYAALAVTGTAARPGIVIDQMEQVLLAAEEARSRREGLRADAPISAPAPTTKPRTPLHPEPRPEPRPLEEPVVIEATATFASAFAEGAPGSAPEAGPGSPPPVGSAPARPPEASSEGVRGPGEEGEEVDRFSLAREFSRLLQDERDPADG